MIRVRCAECGATWSTAARGRVIIACRDCGHKVRVSDAQTVDDAAEGTPSGPLDASPPGQTPAKAPVEPESAPDPPPATTTHPPAPPARKRAQGSPPTRARARVDPAGEPAAHPAPPKEHPEPKIPPAPPGQAHAKATGARGGMAYYRKMFGA